MQLCFRLQGGSDRLVDTLDVVTINKRNIEVKKEYHFASVYNNIATLNEICNVATAVYIFVLTISRQIYRWQNSGNMNFTLWHCFTAHFCTKKNFFYK